MIICKLQTLIFITLGSGKERIDPKVYQLVNYKSTFLRFKISIRFLTTEHQRFFSFKLTGWTVVDSIIAIVVVAAESAKGRGKIDAS